METDVMIAQTYEFDPLECGMRSGPHPSIDSKPSQNRPTLGIQAIAANLLSRKFFTFNQDGVQSRSGAKARAARSCRPAAHNCNVIETHSPQSHPGSGTFPVAALAELRSAPPSS